MTGDDEQRRNRQGEHRGHAREDFVSCFHARTPLFGRHYETPDPRAGVNATGDLERGASGGRRR
jgi:hypothetical protein